MAFVLGLLCGFAWGAVTAWVNQWLLSQHQDDEEPPKPGELLRESRIRSAVDIGSLVVVILLHRVLPFHLGSVLLGTAIAIGVFTIGAAWRAGKEKPAPKTEEEQEQER